MDKNAMDPTNSIPAFYSGKSIFITGATGFLGKALIEKLLRSCPNIAEIFLLMRPKKGANIDERLRQVLTNPLFDILRHEQPDCFNKLIPMEGDIGLEDLGLSAADRDTLIEKTSVIFHVAANVKFDNSLKDAVLKNVRSTRDICVLGKQMKNLTALVYVSTAYTQVDKLIIDEIAYPTKVDWRKTIQVAEVLDEDILEVFKSKYIGTLPNHYIFTKRLAEQIIIDYSSTLPCVICRPSIVTSSLREPIKGWLDNFNGPIALFIAVGKGVMRLMNLDSNTRTNSIAVDIVIKALVVAAWKRGVKMTDTQNNLPLVYNCATITSLNMTHTTMKKNGLDSVRKIPLDGTIWAPNLIHIKNFFFYRLLFLLLDVMPAVLIDGLLRLSGRQPRLVKMQRKIFVGNQVVAYFMMNEWDVRNEKMLNLSDEVPADDQQAFGYAADFVDNYNWATYFDIGIIGSKMYLLNESMDRLDTAKSHLNRMIWIDRIAKALIGIFLLWTIYWIFV